MGLDPKGVYVRQLGEAPYQYADPSGLSSNSKYALRQAYKFSSAEAAEYSERHGMMAPNKWVRVGTLIPLYEGEE